LLRSRERNDVGAEGLQTKGTEALC
jgi:hypothetical protein